jgi:hypothetical protein
MLISRCLPSNGCTCHIATRSLVPVPNNGLICFKEPLNVALRVLWLWDGTLNMHLDTKAGDGPCDEASKKGDNCPVRACSRETRIHLYEAPGGHNHGEVCPGILQDGWTVNREASLGNVVSASQDIFLLAFYLFFLFLSLPLICFSFSFFLPLTWLCFHSEQKAVLKRIVSSFRIPAASSSDLGYRMSFPDVIIGIMALQPLCWAWTTFSVFQFCLLSAGFLARGISPSHSRYILTEEHTKRSIVLVRFEPTIPVSERPKTVYALDRAAPVSDPSHTQGLKLGNYRFLTDIFQFLSCQLYHLTLCTQS